MEPARLLVILGASSAGVAVALGAFAAHSLKERLAPEQLATFTTGVTYHFYHSVAICLVALLIKAEGINASSRSFGWTDALPLSGIAFFVGILLFSGSLYLLSTGAPRWLGPITPLGGLAFLAGWVALAIGAWRT